MTTQPVHIGDITPEALEKLRSLIGVDLRGMQQFNDFATSDTIRHFAWGMGDGNPLWADKEYAAKTRWGRRLAPPAFVQTCRKVLTVGLPGVHALWATDDLEFFLPIYEGDQIICKAKVIGVKEREGSFAGRFIQQDMEHAYHNQRGELVCRLVQTLFRMPTRGGRHKGKYSGVEKAKYTPEILERIFDEMFKHERRGAVPRYWEDVQVGEELSPLVKGPLSEQDMIAAYIGIGATAGIVGGMELYHQYRMRHRSWSYINPETGIIEAPARVHSQDWMARDIGAPSAYDNGGQRITWLCQLVTDWIGDDGFLKQLRVELRRFNSIGDTTWCRGKVVKKYVHAGEHRVGIDLQAMNQRDEVTAPATATVILPSRAGGPVKLPAQPL
ncbi:MAG: MaoC family dehydratase N-terminal domain-containing protein [Chloroflexi bacterium]|nr:MaoC family dehydratase N-terminal domain-containing protein [Chloroflexota bacterium]